MPRSFKFFNFLSVDPKESPNTPLLKLCRTYCILASAAALFVLICISLNSYLRGEFALSQSELLQRGFSISTNLNRFSFVLNWLGLLLLAGAIIYGFRVARQAGTIARKYDQFWKEAKQRTMEIAALYDISQNVSGQYDLSELLQTVLERVKMLLSAAGCAIFLYDPEHDDFQIAAEVGVGMPVGSHLPLREGLAGRVAETREPLIVNDYYNWAARASALKKLPIKAAMCVPMVRGGQLIGVLGVHEVLGSDRMYTEADARLLSLVADNAAGVVHNAQLMDELRKSEERFRIAAECTSDIVYDWDLLTEHVEYFGDRYEQTKAEGIILPQTRQALINMIHPKDRERVQEALNRHFDTGEPFSEEYVAQNGKGEYINIGDRGTAIRNKKGKPVRLIGTVSDITQRKRAEQMKTDFVSFVSHQLRTPLSGVKWMLELATDSLDDPEEMKSYIQDARKSTDRLIGLVNDLLDISRLERGKLQVVYQDVDLMELTHSVVNELSPLTLEKKQELSIEAADSLPKPRADAQLLRQVILNLVSNSVKYTPSGGTIRIRVACDHDRMRWAIQDTGIGIPRDDLVKLFEKFFRAENVQAVETEGTGLGLYLVRLIIERFRGKVWCESEEGKGSTFQFELPLTPLEV